MTPYTTPLSLTEACRLLQMGDTVALPTETVYGLAGLATSDDAVTKIYATKQRPAFNPLIVHCGDADQAATLGIFSPEATLLAQHFWPGPLTLVVPLRAGVAVTPLALAGLSTVALRVPRHPLFQEVLSSTGPLVAPSANPSGRLSATTAAHVLELFQGRVPVVEGGPAGVGVESTIIDCTTPTPRILRVGGISAHDVEACLGRTLITALPHDAIIAPGMQLRHYAPARPLYLNQTVPQPHQAFLTFGPSPMADPLPPGCVVIPLSDHGDTTEAASQLFQALHAADALPGCTSIGVMPIPEVGLGAAINDRLMRAAGAL